MGKEKPSRNFRRAKVRITKGTVARYFPSLHSKHTCGICQEVLHGTPRGRPVEIAKLSKTERRPERPYGGVLCSKCSRHILSIKAKLKHGLMNKEDVSISLRKYV